MKEYLKQILDVSKLKDKGLNNGDNANRKLVEKIAPNILKSWIDEKYIIKGSTGMHPYLFSEILWIGVFDPKITRSASDGYYIVYIFNADGSGVYVSLMIGVTKIKNLNILGEESKKLKAIKLTRVMSDFLYGKIKKQYKNNNWSHEPLDLKAKNELGKGYEQANILSKYYSYDRIPDNEVLLQDLNELLEIYDYLVQEVNKEEYALYIESEFLETRYLLSENIISIDAYGDIVFDLGEDALNVVNVKDNYMGYSIFDNNEILDTNKLLVTEEQLEKQQKIKKSYGNLAEEVVFKYYISEINKKLDIKTAKSVIKELKKVGNTHGYGYDIEAVNLENLTKDNIEKIYIEVKGTTSKEKYEPFFMSKNELIAAMKYGESYRIGRVYDLHAKPPKYFEIAPFKNIDLETIDFEEEIRTQLDVEAINYKIIGWKNSE